MVSKSWLTGVKTAEVVPKQKGLSWWRNKEPPAPAGRICCLCPGVLSRYNKGDRCTRHPDPKVQQEIQAMRPLTRLKPKLSPS